MCLYVISYPCFSRQRKEMAAHSSILAWKIPWTEELGRLQSMGSQSQTRLSDFTFTFHFHALEKAMATHSGVLAWRIPGTGEPGGLPSMGWRRVGHDWSDSAAAAAKFPAPPPPYFWCVCVICCVRLCDPMDCSPPCSSVHGVFVGFARFWLLRNLSFLIWYNGEGNGTPLQYSCLENPMDREAW